MRQHVNVNDLAAGLEVPLCTVEATAAAASIRIVMDGGRRLLRLSDAGRIVQAPGPARGLPVAGLHRGMGPRGDACRALMHPPRARCQGYR